ncbi:MAG: excinuclease ABC subunit UvrC [Coriobacteriales bacterium]|jgi:excinuclease ABC subunit C|nr:excinuclease ABC subunit UvrC [Coriobacteriales bacterium]
MKTKPTSNLQKLKEQLVAVPQEPGVYLWKDATGDVLYVGKAKQLRSRMRQYVNFQDERAMIPALMAGVRSFDYFVVASEHESLILERNLINQFSPPFNVDFKDDKSYPFIALSLGDDFPAIKFTREKPRSDTRYFGPYTDSRAARQTIDTARMIVPICIASCVEWKRLRRRLEQELPVDSSVKACFDYHVGLGPGPCAGVCTQAEYAGNVKRLVRFLSGHRQEFIRTLKHEIAVAAKELDFERAARAKKRLDTLTSLNDRQNVVLSPRLNADVIGFFREETITGVQVLSVREGIVLISNEFILDKGRDVSDDDLIRGFLLRYYDQASQIPRELIMREIPNDAGALEVWLTRKLASKHGAKVRLNRPSKGQRSQLLKLAELNARHALSRYMIRTSYHEERCNRALLELESALALPEAPMRIECYDISTLHGSYSVASMVVFSGGRADKSHYRRFKIRLDSPEANDVAMMTELIQRRFSQKNQNDTRFGKHPDLLIIDGGKPQLNAVVRQLEQQGINGIDVAGLAKADEELYVTWQDTPVILPAGSVSLYLVKQIRDEAHRFAISYHRKLRGQGQTNSILDSIEGLGPKRKRLLRRAFKTQKALRSATLEQLEQVAGIPKAVAKSVFITLQEQPQGDEYGT